MLLHYAVLLTNKPQIIAEKVQEPFVSGNLTDQATILPNCNDSGKKGKYNGLQHLNWEVLFEQNLCCAIAASCTNPSFSTCTI